MHNGQQTLSGLFAKLSAEPSLQMVGECLACHTVDVPGHVEE